MDLEGSYQEGDSEGNSLERSERFQDEIGEEDWPKTNSKDTLKRRIGSTADNMEAEVQK